jgi:alanyl-tRNA synthetase
LDAEVKRQIRIKNAAKKGSVAFIQAQTEIRRLLKQKKDLNEKVEKAAKDEQQQQGTSAFDLLTQNAQTFLQTGGNLINGQQPFAGPTGFTADIAQFLHRPSNAVVVPTSKEDANVPLITSNAELIRVIQDNTDAIRESAGMDGKGGKGKQAMAARWSVGSFYQARVARQLTEAESP